MCGVDIYKCSREEWLESLEHFKNFKPEPDIQALLDKVTLMAKSNDCEATLRKGNLPPASAGSDGAGTEDKGAAVRCAEKQNNGNVLCLKLSQEEATAAARKRVNEDDGALNSDVADHK